MSIDPNTSHGARKKDFFSLQPANAGSNLMLRPNKKGEVFGADNSKLIRRSDEDSLENYKSQSMPISPHNKPKVSDG